MAIKTMTGGNSGQNPYARGWHAATIKSAEEGTWNDTKYIDVRFENYNDYFKLRVYERHNKETNEEFAIARLFKFANAGIISVLKDQTGNKPVIQYDDDVAGLVGKKLNIYVVDNKKNSEFAAVWDRYAPVAQEGEHISYSDDDVAFWKKQAEDNHAEYGKVESNGAVTDDAMQPVPPVPRATDEVPF